MTEGEEFIVDFLRCENIAFETQKLISSLKGDSKGHRVVDFYLTKYKVYIEFYGQWNIEKHKDRYREKTKVYKENEVPCIFLYPENLGIIEYIFHKRLILTLKKYKLNKELIRYRINEIWKRCSENIKFLIIGISLLFSIYPWTKNNNSEFVLSAGIIIYQTYIISKHIIQIVKFGPKNKRIYF